MADRTIALGSRGAYVLFCFASVSLYGHMVDGIIAFGYRRACVFLCVSCWQDISSPWFYCHATDGTQSLFLCSSFLLICHVCRECVHFCVASWSMANRTITVLVLVELARCFADNCFVSVWLYTW